MNMHFNQREQFTVGGQQGQGDDEPNPFQREFFDRASLRDMRFQQGGMNQPDSQPAQRDLLRAETAVGVGLRSDSGIRRLDPDQLPGDTIGSLFGSPAKRAEAQGFDQPVHKDTGIWGEIKGLFGAHQETYGDEVKKHVFDQLSPQDQKELKRELKQRDEEMRRFETQDFIGGRFPNQDYPMIDKYNHMVRQEENGISRQVLASMSPEDRRELQREERQYYAPERFNPEGPLVEPQRHPGPMLQEYWRRLGQYTQRYASGGDGDGDDRPRPAVGPEVGGPILEHRGPQLRPDAQPLLRDQKDDPFPADKPYFM